jgi:hypothetical protein
MIMIYCKVYKEYNKHNNNNNNLIIQTKIIIKKIIMTMTMTMIYNNK